MTGNEKGKLVCLEGIDGAGKSTVGNVLSGREGYEIKQG